MVHIECIDGTVLVLIYLWPPLEDGFTYVGISEGTTGLSGLLHNGGESGVTTMNLPHFTLQMMRPCVMELTVTRGSVQRNTEETTQ